MPEDIKLLKEITSLKKKVSETTLPPELKDRALMLLERLTRMIEHGKYSAEYEQTAYYIDWITSLPWEKRSEDLLELKHAREVLDQNHYGLDEVKERILEYLAVLALKKQKGQKGKEEQKRSEISEITRAPILCFVGLVGTGKTTLASSIAEAMGRQFARIPFGGMGSALDLRGQSRVHADAEVGLVMKAIRRCQTKNPVILLDEIDRVAENTRSDIMGVLIELLDPEQNMAFRDHFIDHPFDLSEALFITTCNNTSSISPAVLDRLELIQMPSYRDEEKIIIGRDYVLPSVMEKTGLTKENLQIANDVWPKLVRPLGYDAGIRTLSRTVSRICRRVAKMIVEGKGKSFTLTAENYRQFIPSW